MSKKAFTPTPKPTLEAVLDWADVPYNADRQRQMCHCPLDHPGGDRTPSLSVDLTDQLWKCHACNNGGDSWTMIQKKAGVDFVGATKIARSEGFAAGAADEDEPAGFAFGRGATPGARQPSRSGGPAFRPSWRN